MDQARSEPSTPAAPRPPHRLLEQVQVNRPPSRILPGRATGRTELVEAISQVLVNRSRADVVWVERHLRRHAIGAVVRPQPLLRSLPHASQHDFRQRRAPVCGKESEGLRGSCQDRTTNDRSARRATPPRRYYLDRTYRPDPHPHRSRWEQLTTDSLSSHKPGRSRALRRLCTLTSPRILLSILDHHRNGECPLPTGISTVVAFVASAETACIMRPIETGRFPGTRDASGHWITTSGTARRCKFVRG